MTDTDLIAWLRAQLDDDERVARRPAPAPWSLMGEPRETRVVSHAGVTVALGWLRDLEHMARHDPARVLAEVAAKRAILDAVERYLNPHPGQRCTNEDDPDDACELHVEWMRTAIKPLAARLLAVPYADRPGYREEWRP